MIIGRGVFYRAPLHGPRIVIIAILLVTYHPITGRILENPGASPAAG